MEPRSIQELASSCAGRVLRGDARTPVLRVVIDSREVQPGDLFVAIRGERHDGHRFMSEAAARGAVGVVAEKLEAPDPLPNCCVVSVGNTRRALGDMAAWHRRAFDIPVIVVVGSNGKTTTKNLIAAVLARRFRTLSSEASFNNDIGVPLTLLKLDRCHEIAVLEAGTNHPGELAVLLDIIRPTAGVLTSIGREHLEFFHNLEGVLAEEGQVAGHIGSEGVLVVNGDAEGIERVILRTHAVVVRVGCSKTNDWQVLSTLVGDDGTMFAVRAPFREHGGKYKVRLLGKHQALNAALALAVGAQFGLQRGELETGLMSCCPAKHRMQLMDLAGVRVLDDTYNANADSMGAALETMSALPCPGRRIAVLGEMGEQGDQAPALHAEVGRYAATLGVQHIFAVGRMASIYAEAARAVREVDVREYPDNAAAAQAVCAFVRKGDLVLAKASRAMRMEEVVEALSARSTELGEAAWNGGGDARAEPGHGCAESICTGGRVEDAERQFC